jgi:nitrate/nitrite transporter NarK
VAIGFGAKSWTIVLSGRIIFALGGENLIVATSALLADWFIGKELAFAFGINLALARVGGVINNYFSVYIARVASVPVANWAGAIICGMSVASVILTIPIDKAFDKSIADAKSAITNNADTTELTRGQEEGYGSIADANDANTPLSSVVAGGQVTEAQEKKSTVREDFAQMPLIFWVLIVITVITYGVVIPFNNVASSLLLERTYFTATPADCILPISGQCQSAANAPTCMVTSDMAPPLPYNVTIAGTYYPQVTSSDVNCDSTDWNTGCTAGYCTALNKAEQTVSVIMSIPYVISGVASPILGLAVDYYGFRAWGVLLSAVILLTVHSCLAWSSDSPIGPLVGQGLAYTAFAAVLWPAIPMMVPEELRGLAFGIGTASYNAGCAAVPLIAAAIYTHSNNSYIPNVEILFVGMSVVSMVLGVWLNYLDYVHHDGMLNKGLIETDAEKAVVVGDQVYSAVHSDDRID